MITCAICLNSLVLPVSVPCGHVFCQSCILAVIHQHPHQSRHDCPTCRVPFLIHTIDRSLVPDSSLPFVLPSVRRLYFQSSSTPVQADTQSSADNDRLREEIATIKDRCESWRLCAAGHASSSLKLARSVKETGEYAHRLKTERDNLLVECRKLREELRSMELVKPEAQDQTAEQLKGNTLVENPSLGQEPEARTILETLPSCPSPLLPGIPDLLDESLQTIASGTTPIPIAVPLTFQPHPGR